MTKQRTKSTRYHDEKRMRFIGLQTNHITSNHHNPPRCYDIDQEKRN